MNNQRLCSQCENFFDVDLDPQELKRRDNAANFGGFDYVCDGCSGNDQLPEGVIVDDCEEWDGEESDYICQDCGNMLPAMFATCDECEAVNGISVHTSEDCYFVCRDCGGILDAPFAECDACSDLKHEFDYFCYLCGEAHEVGVKSGGICARCEYEQEHPSDEKELDTSEFDLQPVIF